MGAANYSFHEATVRGLAEGPGMDFVQEFALLWNRYRKALIRCRGKLSPKPLHCLRLALRRLVVVLEFCQSAYPSRESDESVRCFKKQLKKLGELRDIQTQMALVTRHKKIWPCLRRYRKELRSERKARCRKLARFLCGLKIKKIHTPFRKGLKPCLSAFRETSTSSEEAFERAWSHLRSLQLRFEHRMCAMDAGDPGSLHRLRVAIKYLRYALEFLKPLLNLQEEEALHQLTAWQIQLGRIQDMRVLLDDLRIWLEEQPKSVRREFKNPSGALERRLADRAIHVTSKISHTPVRWTPDSHLADGKYGRGNGHV